MWHILQKSRPFHAQKIIQNKKTRKNVISQLCLIKPTHAPLPFVEASMWQVSEHPRTCTTLGGNLVVWIIALGVGGMLIKVLYCSNYHQLACHSGIFLNSCFQVFGCHVFGIKNFFVGLILSHRYSKSQKRSWRLNRGAVDQRWHGKSNPIR